MSGKRTKQLRRERGTSIHARREQRLFERAIVTTHERRASGVVRSVRLRRTVFAVGGLIVIAASILAGLFL